MPLRHRLTHRPLAARLIGAAAAVLLAATALPALGATASASTATSAGSVIAAINAARAANGVPALPEASDLDATAMAHTRVMAADNSLFHSPSLGAGICCWAALGENVGEGTSVSYVDTLFMQSPGHRANILNASWTDVGVAVVRDSHGTYWITEQFRKRSGSSAPVGVTRTSHRSAVRSSAPSRVQATSRSSFRTAPSAAALAAARVSALGSRVALLRARMLAVRVDPLTQSRAWAAAMRVLGG